ncbi:MAG: hypothetical protein EOP84_06975 [Verrucomicrobiaceae bacterium]|nr:MAG: hypothetical protein EOP84_06975 [Verrucomicrobiaceae bacterium]
MIAVALVIGIGIVAVTLISNSYNPREKLREAGLGLLIVIAGAVETVLSFKDASAEIQRYSKIGTVIALLFWLCLAKSPRHSFNAFRSQYGAKKNQKSEVEGRSRKNC